MKNVIFMSGLSIWSMASGKGAPSFYKTVEAYAKNGWNVFLIIPKDKDAATPEMEGVQIYTFDKLDKQSGKNRYTQCLLNYKNGIYSKKNFIRIAKDILKTLNPAETVLYAYEVHSVSAGKKLSKETGIKLVTRFQGTILSKIKNNALNRFGYYPHFQALATPSDLVVMTDDGTLGDEVLLDLGNKTETLFLRNGIDFKKKPVDVEKVKALKEKYGIEDNEKVFMTVSRLENWKKVDRAITLLSGLSKKMSNCKLIIIGDGTEKNNLVQLSKELHIEDKVVFAGAVDHDDIQDYMSFADIFLSLYDLSNVGNPLLEAMICGKTIITLDVGATNKIIRNEENGILLKIEELDKLPDVAYELLCNAEKANKLAIQAQDDAEKTFWTWDERMNYEIEKVKCLVAE